MEQVFNEIPPRAEAIPNGAMNHPKHPKAMKRYENDLCVFFIQLYSIAFHNQRVIFPFNSSNYDSGKF